MTKKKAGGATTRNSLAGVNGNSAATATTVSEQTSEGVLTGADDEDDQHLRGHRLNKPACMKERLYGMEDHQHNVECRR